MKPKSTVYILTPEVVLGKPALLRSRRGDRERCLYRLPTGITLTDREGVEFDASYWYADCSAAQVLERGNHLAHPGYAKIIQSSKRYGSAVDYYVEVRRDYAASAPDGSRRKATWRSHQVCPSVISEALERHRMSRQGAIERAERARAVLGGRVDASVDTEASKTVARLLADTARLSADMEPMRVEREACGRAPVAGTS